MITTGDERHYDLVVVGGGIAGCETAREAARGGLDTLLVTTSLDTIYNGVGDSAPLDAPAGSLMAELVPALSGPGGAVRWYDLHRAVKYELETEPRLHLLQSTVSGLLERGGVVEGVATWEGVDRLASRTVLALGSFAGARLTIGSSSEAAGRLSEMAYDDLYHDLVRRGFLFEELDLSAPAQHGALPYTVSCRHLAPSEWREEEFELTRLGALYAAGLFGAGYLSYEAAADQGVRLGASLSTSR